MCRFYYEKYGAYYIYAHVSYDLFDISNCVVMHTAFFFSFLMFYVVYNLIQHMSLIISKSSLNVSNVKRERVLKILREKNIREKELKILGYIIWLG